MLLLCYNIFFSLYRYYFVINFFFINRCFLTKTVFICWFFFHYIINKDVFYEHANYVLKLVLMSLLFLYIMYAMFKLKKITKWQMNLQKNGFFRVYIYISYVYHNFFKWFFLSINIYCQHDTTRSVLKYYVFYN